MSRFQEDYPNFPFPLPLLLDGATGTAMIRAGMPAGVCPEAWILEHPNALRETQCAYLAAGSDAVLAPTFGANRAVLKRYRKEAEGAEMNRALASLSREVAGTRLVGGDLSPTGKFLFPIGDATAEELREDYRTQIRALDPLVDFFMVETFMDLAAARAAVSAVRAESDKPIFVTLTLTSAGKTMSGDDPAAALLTLAELSVSAFGFNCSTGPAEMLPWLEALLPLSRALRIPLIAKPNAGPSAVCGTRASLPPEEFGRIAGQMLRCGVGILGGCCGTDARHIEALRAAVDAHTGDESRTEPIGTSRLFCNSRTVLSAPETMPEPLAADALFAENAEEQAENFGFAFVKLQNRADAETVAEALPLCPFPLAVCGDAEAIALLRRDYCGKLLCV